MDNAIANELGEVVGVADIIGATTNDNSNSPNSKNGCITLNLGSAETGELMSANVQFFSLPGIIATPVLPPKTANNSSAMEAVYLNRGGSKIVIATRDIAAQALAGTMKLGELCLFASGTDRKSQNSIKLTNDGAVSIGIQKGNSSGGGAISIVLKPDDSIVASNSSGSQLKIDADGALLASKSSSVDCKASGEVQVVANASISMQSGSGSISVSSGTTVDVTGTSITLGGDASQAVLTVADLPAIFALISTAFSSITPGGVIVTGGQPAAAAIASGQAAVISAASTKVTKAM